MHRELQVGVKILLKNESGKYLLIRRNPKKYPEVGLKWDIVGGRINPGTDLLTNLKREVKEETGLILKTKIILVAAQDILRVPDKHIVRITYQGMISGVTNIDEESLEYKWFTKAEILKLRSKELDIYFIELLKKNLISW